jgi:hypothetical protein
MHAANGILFDGLGKFHNYRKADGAG